MSSWKVPEAFVWDAVNSAGLFLFEQFCQFQYATGFNLVGGIVIYGFVQSLDSSLYPPFMVFVTHNSCGVNCFSKQSAIALALSFG